MVAATARGSLAFYDAQGATRRATSLISTLAAHMHNNIKLGWARFVGFQFAFEPLTRQHERSAEEPVHYRGQFASETIRDVKSIRFRTKEVTYIKANRFEMFTSRNL
jgi:hypothetical protein